MALFSHRLALEVVPLILHVKSTHYPWLASEMCFPIWKYWFLSFPFGPFSHFFFFKMKGTVVGNLLCEGPIRAKHACVLHARILWFNLVALFPNDYQTSTCIILALSYLYEVFTQIPESHFMVVCLEPGVLRVTMLSRSLIVHYTMEADTGRVGPCNALQEQAPSAFGTNLQLLANKTTSGTFRVTCISSSEKEKQCWNISTCFSIWSFPCGLFCQPSSTAWELGNSRGNFFLIDKWCVFFIDKRPLSFPLLCTCIYSLFIHRVSICSAYCLKSTHTDVYWTFPTQDGCCCGLPPMHWLVHLRAVSELVLCCRCPTPPPFW